jgi:hypothetical protein
MDKAREQHNVLMDKGREQLTAFGVSCYNMLVKIVFIIPTLELFVLKI